MVKTGARGPGRQRLLPPVGKGLLEAAISLDGSNQQLHQHGGREYQVEADHPLEQGQPFFNSSQPLFNPAQAFLLAHCLDGLTDLPVANTINALKVKRKL
jgi:hypothetical protein